MGYIPEPQPQKSEIEITAFYYPGTEQMAEWDQVEQTLPGIKPLLGWYDESNPEVIDWQIKWAVEHGISSFCLDWYWNQGDQRLDHWIKSFYKARFRKYLKWYMMWANHNEISADFFGLFFDKIRNTAHKGENQNDTGNTNGNTKTSQKRASAVFLNGSLSEAEMGSG